MHDDAPALMPVGGKLEGLGESLQASGNISLDLYKSLLSDDLYQTLGKLIRDISKIESEMQRLHANLTDLNIRIG